MIALQQALAKSRSGTTVPRNSPAYAPQANGSAEKTVQDVTDFMRRRVKRGRRSSNAIPSGINSDRGVGAHELQSGTAFDSQGHRHAWRDPPCSTARRPAAIVEVFPFGFTLPARMLGIRGTAVFTVCALKNGRLAGILTSFDDRRWVAFGYITCCQPMLFCTKL